MPPSHPRPQALGPGSKAMGFKQGRTTSGQPPGWFAKSDALKAAGIKSLSTAEVQAAMKKGWLLIDVSPEEEFRAYHAAGAINVPAVKLGAGAESTALSQLRGALFSSQGVQARRLRRRLPRRRALSNEPPLRTSALLTHPAQSATARAQHLQVNSRSRE